MNSDGQGFSIRYSVSKGWSWAVYLPAPYSKGVSESLERDAVIEEALAVCAQAGMDLSSLPCNQEMDELILLCADTGPHEAEIVLGRFQGKDGLYYDLQDSYRLAFEERSSRIVARAPEGGAPFAQAMLEVAAAKGCWRVEVHGQDNFRREVWRAGKNLQVEVVGFDPTGDDQEELAVLACSPVDVLDVPRAHSLAAQIDAGVFSTLLATGGMIRARVYCPERGGYTPECLVNVDAGSATCQHQGRSWGVLDAIAKGGETFLYMRHT